VELGEAVTERDVADARELFAEYAATLNFSVCFQGFEEELRTLPGSYAPPRGKLMLLRADGEPAGCIALKPLDARRCEMKRLYVRPAFRGRGFGEELVHRLISDARTLGYATICLDTIVGRMDAAIALYRRLGFREIPAYYDNPIENALYLELTL
jgi:ribosomal protein S18 acetylase RimI-like enzyme